MIPRAVPCVLPPGSGSGGTGGDALPGARVSAGMIVVIVSAPVAACLACVYCVWMRRRRRNRGCLAARRPRPTTVKEAQVVELGGMVVNPVARAGGAGSHMPHGAHQQAGVSTRQLRVAALGGHAAGGEAPVVELGGMVVNPVARAGGAGSHWPHAAHQQASVSTRQLRVAALDGHDAGGEAPVVELGGMVVNPFARAGGAGSHWPHAAQKQAGVSTRQLRVAALGGHATGGEAPVVELGGMVVNPFARAGGAGSHMPHGAHQHAGVSMRQLRVAALDGHDAGVPRTATRL